MRYWRIPFLGCFLSFAVAKEEGVCRQLRYTQEIQDKRLDGHVFRSCRVKNTPDCGVQCFLEQFCLSYNLGPFQSGEHLCELSNSDAIRHPMDLIPHPGYNYQGTKNACSSSPCPSLANCSSLSETDFRCVCPEGYTGVNCDTDIDECTSGSHSCHASADCTNQIGSYNCTCRPGFIGDGFTCNDIDECVSNPCDVSATCTNTPGSFQCACNAGSFGDGFSCITGGTDCRTIKNSHINTPSGLYPLLPTNNPNNVIKAYCDMTSFGGGWTMCYTTDSLADPKDETTYDENLPYGTNGYRTNCNDIEFSEIIFIDEETQQKEYFSKKSGAKSKPAYSHLASPQGLWDSHGLADSSYSYQLLICDNSFYSGFHVSGYTNNCYKRCNHWCGDLSSPYFRTAATNSGYNGVAFNTNGHRPKTNKLVSVGLR